jgi:AraC-like DNA-binding protein
MRLSHETALAQLVGSIRQLCGRTVTPSYVGFQHSAPKVKEPHRSFFGCEIDFDAPFDRVVLARDPFELEPRGANAAIWSWLSTQADAELAKLAPRPLAQRVREEIGRALTLEAVASMTSVAATLGVSERTLRRALAAGGVTFRTLTDEARRDIAKTMLGREGTTITRVALEAGFADPSAFTHACRRWFGRSPSEIAQDAQRGRDD